MNDEAKQVARAIGQSCAADIIEMMNPAIQALAERLRLTESESIDLIRTVGLLVADVMVRANEMTDEVLREQARRARRESPHP